MCCVALEEFAQHGLLYDFLLKNQTLFFLFLITNAFRPIVGLSASTFVTIKKPCNLRLQGGYLWRGVLESNQ